MTKVLFVDDEPQILELLQLIFDWEELGFEVIGTASDGTEALKILQANPVDILVTDVNMPNMGGLELIKEVRTRYPDMLVVIISAYDDFNYLKKALALKVEDYLLKPIIEDEFLQVLENLQEKHSKNLLHKDSKTDHNSNYIRSNLLNRLIKNRISYLELEEKDRFLNISLNHQFYNLIIIKIKTEVKFGSLADSLSTSLNISKDTFELIEDFDNNLVLLVGDESKSALDDSLQSKKDAILPLLQKENIEYIISTGLVTNDILNISQSYIHAQRLSGEIIIKNETINSSNDNISFNIDYRKIKKLLVASDYPDAYKFIESIFKSFKGKIPFPFEANNIALRLVAWIDNFYNELNVTLQESSQYYDYLILGILKSKSSDSLADYIIEHITLYHKQSQLRTKDYSPIISQIKGYVDDNFHENINLKSLSLKYNVNSSYLGQLFNNEVGEYFNDYLNTLRNKKASDLLLNTDLTNYEIAMKLGYTEPSYFYKKFKSYHGVSPSVFRSKKQ